MKHLTKLALMILLILILVLPLTVLAENVQADFIGTPISGSAPLEVHFTDTSINEVGDGWTYEWNYGTCTSPGNCEPIGVFSTEQNPVYTFNENGNYYILFTLDNGVDDSDSILKENYISVGSIPTPTETIPVSCQNTTLNYVTIDNSSTPWEMSCGQSRWGVSFENDNMTYYQCGSQTCSTGNYGNEPLYAIFGLAGGTVGAMLIVRRKTK